MAQNRPLWKLLVASGTMQSALTVVQARNDNDDLCTFQSLGNALFHNSPIT